jgi:hypothetical protein
MVDTSTLWYQISLLDMLSSAWDLCSFGVKSMVLVENEIIAKNCRSRNRFFAQIRYPLAEISSDRQNGTTHCTSNLKTWIQPSHSIAVSVKGSNFHIHRNVGVHNGYRS